MKEENKGYKFSYGSFSKLPVEKLIAQLIGEKSRFLLYRVFDKQGQLRPLNESFSNRKNLFPHPTAIACSAPELCGL